MAIKKSKCEDKSRYDIVADLRKRGKSLAALGRENGLSISTVKNALDKPYPRGKELLPMHWELSHETSGLRGIENATTM